MQDTFSKKRAHIMKETAHTMTLQQDKEERIVSKREIAIEKGKQKKAPATSRLRAEKVSKGQKQPRYVKQSVVQYDTSDDESDERTAGSSGATDTISMGKESIEIKPKVGEKVKPERAEKPKEAEPEKGTTKVPKPEKKQLDCDDN